MSFVVDTSIVAKIFLAEADRDKALGLLASAIRNESRLIAPSLMLYELNNALISKGATGKHYDTAMTTVMNWVRSDVVEIVEPNEALLRRAEAIASMDTQGKGYISSFDATFHALALMRGATFVTADVVYVRKTKAVLGGVELLQDIQS